MTTLTLYGTPVSTYVRTVRLLLSEANADYALEDIGIFNGDNETGEYLKKHPFGKVPALGIDNEIVYETDAITDYLNETAANGSYSPNDPLQTARMRQIIAVINNYLYSHAVGKIVIQRLVVPQQGGQTDEGAVQSAIAPTKKALEAIEKLCVGTPFLVGSSITLADFYLIPIFVYLSQTKEYDMITANTPKLRVWWQQAQSLNSVKQVCS